MITLNKLIIKNYKSIQDIELNLGNLNVFVGPNNAGKSNILDCLKFLAEFILKGTEAINLRGGFSNIVWNGEFERVITIEVHSLPYIYRIEIVGRLPANYYLDFCIFCRVEVDAITQVLDRQQIVKNILLNRLKM